MSANNPRATYIPGPRRADERRAALLGALEELLAARSLSEIGIADMTTAAGLTRSAFYFYFPTKAAAVAALLADFYEEMQQAAADWYEGGTGTPLERLRTGFQASAELWRARAGLLVAMLDAIGTDPEVRDVWNTWIGGFVDRITDRISQDRQAGLARDSTTDPHALAIVLLGAALYTMEHDVRAIRAGQPPDDTLQAAIIETWYRTIYRS
jgi:AcrR family transcriptional regulator